MQYLCDAGDLTWFRIDTLGEAVLESRAMNHAVERYFREAYEKAAASYVPPKGAPLAEQNIGLKSHIQRSMPVFVTLRDREGTALVTAMLPPEAVDESSFRPIVVGPSNANPYVDHGQAIEKLAAARNLQLNATRCYPYRRS